MPTSTNNIIAFPYLLTQIYLITRVQENQDIDQFIRTWTTKYVVLIKDNANPISKEAKIGATMIRKVYVAKGKEIETTRLTDKGETLTTTTQFEPQISTNATGTC